MPDATSAAGRSPGHNALRRGRISIPDQIYLVTAATQHRLPVFVNLEAARAASRIFGHAALLGDATMLAWVLMPDHAHWLIQLGVCKTLSTLINALKSASAREVNKALVREGNVWARSFHDHALRQEDDVLDAARYIVANPIRARFVSRVGDYPYWDAMWLPVKKPGIP